MNLDWMSPADWIALTVIGGLGAYLVGDIIADVVRWRRDNPDE